MNRDELITALKQSAAQKPRSTFIKGLGQVYIRALTVEEVEDQMDSSEPEKSIGPDGKEVLVAKPKDKRSLARSAARILSDENGNRVLDPDSADDVSLLARLPWSVLKKVLDASEDLKVEEGAAEGN